MPDLLGVFREPEYSPGRVSDDAAILERTADALAARGLALRTGGPEMLDDGAPDAVLAMCQSTSALAALDRHAASVPVINTPAAIRNCHRVATVNLLADGPARFPQSRIVDTNAALPAVGTPCWIKRGDVHAMEAADVVFAPDRDAALAALASFAARGIERAVVQEHIAGTVVKFYGVGDAFFRCYTDGPPPPGALTALREAARAGARRLGLEVFGGDLVLPAAGAPVLVDVNDWPSFARCREEAAEAIATHVCDRLDAARTAPRRAEGR
jgi:hypothetical protein